MEDLVRTRLGAAALLAEIIGAFAVVVSLVYVGIQVNQSVQAARSESVNDANVALQSWYLEVGSDQQTSDIFYNGLMSEEALPTPQEEFRFLMMFHAVFWRSRTATGCTRKGRWTPSFSTPSRRRSWV